MWIHEQVADGNESKQQPPWRFYLQTTLCWDDVHSGDKAMGSELKSGGQLPHASAVLGSPIHHVGFGKAAIADLNQRIDWKWLKAAFSTAGSPYFSSATMWAGHGGGATPMQCVCQSRPPGCLAMPAALLDVSPADP